MSAEDDKRAAQLSFLGAENIKAFYQQISAEGTISAEGESLTQQIAHDIFPEIEQPDIQREIGLETEIDLEPER